MTKSYKLVKKCHKKCQTYEKIDKLVKKATNVEKKLTQKCEFKSQKVTNYCKKVTN